MRIISSYLKSRRKMLLFYLLFTGINMGVFVLYNIPGDAVCYAFSLTLTVLVIYGIFDFWKYSEKYHRMENIKQQKILDMDSLPKAADHIEQRYQEKLKQISEEKAGLESAVRIARQEMKDYYGMWVHQIKTPIAALQVLLQSEEQSVPAMKQEVFKIEQYVEMVLTYIRMEEMGADLRFEKYSLDKIVKQAVKKYSQLFILKKIRLDYQPLQEEILTDEKWMTFVVEQIISNALKYTKTGAIRIYVKEGNLVIEDTGIGIWPEDLPRVFEKGFTGYNGRTDKKSTGIGLYLCKSILDKLKNPIWIESTVDRGTKVFICLERKELCVE